MDERAKKKGTGKRSKICLDTYESNGMVEWVRDLQPAHFLLKIESYSLLAAAIAEVDCYESGPFEASGYNWRLVFYPLVRMGSDQESANHISLNLRIDGSKALPFGWGIDVCFKLFVQDQILGKYLTIQGDVKRFSAINTEWGFPKFLPIDIFKDESKGYLVNDSCVFGAEVFVVKNTGKWECLSMVKDPPFATYTWKIENFRERMEEYYESPTFFIEGRKWMLYMYPNGETSEEEGRMLSMYLDLFDCEIFPPKTRVYADVTLRIRDQLQNKHYEDNLKGWFGASCESWGYRDFISLHDLRDSSEGYIVNDTLIAEVEFKVVSITKDY